MHLLSLAIAADHVVGVALCRVEVEYPEETFVTALEHDHLVVLVLATHVLIAATTTTC